MVTMVDMTQTATPEAIMPTTDEFLALRADWYARDMPSDHPYAEMLRESEADRVANRSTFVEPLVVFR